MELNLCDITGSLDFADRSSGPAASAPPDSRINLRAVQMRIDSESSKVEPSCERTPSAARYQARSTRCAQNPLANADHGIRLAVDLERAADENIASAMPLPESVAGNDDGCLHSACILRVIKSAAERLRSMSEK